MSEETVATRPCPTILCIDDDQLVLHFLREFLEPRGYRILTTDDGPGGLALAKRHHPDLILLDVVMFNMSGFDICRKLRAIPQLRTTPIILLTVLDESQMGTAGTEAGATVTLRKPADPETLLTTIERLLGPPMKPDRS